VRQPRVDVLYFDGCTRYEHAHRLVQRVAAELELEPEIRLVEIPDAEAALQLRFLGSPTIRVDGRDVEPGADEREGFVFACRLYRGERGYAGHPEAAWVREALAEAAA
jgi:hypothetical protein